MTTLARKSDLYRTMAPAAVLGFLLILLAQNNVIFGAGLAIAAGILILMLRWPEVGTLAVVFAIYANLPVILIRFHKIPDILAASVSLLLVIPLAYFLIVRKEQLIVDRTFLWMLAFLAALFASSFFARDVSIVENQIVRYLIEGLAVYFLVINVIRTLPTLKKVICAVLMAGCLMGGLSIFQEATHTWNNDYAGFAQRGGVFGLDQTGRENILRTRSAGPIGEQNRYAQIMLVLVPFAWLLYGNKKRRLVRMFGAVSGVLILGGMVLSFSRGAFIGFILMFIFAMTLKFLKTRQAAFLLLGFALAIVMVKPDYLIRINSLGHIGGLFSQTTPETDPSVVNRYAENIAAFHVFLKHPLVGVGPGHFAPYYSQTFVNRLGITEESAAMRGHNLYLEMAAETGLIGLICFLAIVGTVLLQLWRARRLTVESDGYLANLPTAFILSIAAYLATAVFLQLAYQRYFWLLLAIASAAARLIIARSHGTPPDISGNETKEPALVHY